MSFASGLTGVLGNQFGLGGGAPGLNYQAQSANILQPTNAQQIQGAYGQAQSGIGQQQDFLNALAGQNGIGNQSNVFNQQQQLANQLQGVANGTGPNPALAQLNQTTGQNVAAQAALMAGQRGSSANPGLMARQIAQQGAGIQQNAVGQGATLGAQQQLGAMSALGQQQANMGNLATQQVGQQGQALGGLNTYGQNEQANLLGALGQYNNANVAMQSNMNNANAGISQIAAKNQTQTAPNGGQMLSTFSSMGSGAAAMGAEGGMVDKVSGRSSAYRFLNNKSAGKMIAHGGPIIGESYANAKMPVPGKAKVKGDSLKNDFVDAKLSPGEGIIPRHIMNSPNAPELAAKFVAEIKAKKKGKA